MTEQVTAEEVRRLLLAYEIALDTADSLPRLVRIASRPRRWTVFEPLRRLPRPTVGTSSMVTYHVQRSMATLVRRYGRIAATRGLTEEDERASGLVKNFRDVDLGRTTTTWNVPRSVGSTSLNGHYSPG